MAELDEFTSLSQGMSLDDFSLEKQGVKAYNRPSSMNYAAYSAVLGSPEAVESNYRSIMGEMEAGSQDVSSTIKKAVEERRFASARSEAIKIFTDPNLPMDQKEKAAQGYIDSVNKINPLVNIVSEEALIDESLGETREAEITRLNMAEAIESVNQHKKEVQAIMNAEMAKVDTDISNSVVSFAELMVPFMEQSQFAKIMGDYKQGDEISPTKAIALLGEARKDLKDNLKKLPPEQRIEAIRNLVDIVNNHKGIALTDDNDFTHLHNLQTILEDGYYTDVDRWVDNVTSLLDMTLLGGTIAKGISRGRRALKGAGTGVGPSEAATPAVRALEASEEAFDPILKAGQDFDDGWGLKEATHYAGIINNHKGEQASKDYLEEFKRLELEPDEVKGFGGDVPDFFNVEGRKVSKTPKTATKMENTPEGLVASGTFTLRHNSNNPDLKAFDAKYKGDDRYDGDGGVFGGKVVYLDNHGQWTNATSGLGRWKISNVYEVQVDFKKAFVLTPDNIEELSKIMEGHKGTLPPNNNQRAIYSGEDVTKVLKKKGYDGLVIQGFEDFNADISKKASYFDPEERRLEPGTYPDLEKIRDEHLNNLVKEGMEWNKEKIGKGLHDFEVTDLLFSSRKLSGNMAQDQVIAFNPKSIKVLGKVDSADNPMQPLDIASKAVRNLVRSEVSPVSLSQNYKDVNPSKARAIHEMVAGDLTEEAAMATYGTNRTNAIANDLLPEVGNNGAVKNKVGSIDANFVDSVTPNPKIVDFVTNRGDIYYFMEEKVKQRARVVNDFKNAFGLHARDEMFNIEAMPDGVRINAIYGPKEGGFSNPQSAIDLAKFAMRDYGIREDQIMLLTRKGEDYVPTTLNEVRGGDFLIGIRHDYKFDPADIVEWMNTDTRLNIFDYIPPIFGDSAGSFQRHILDAHSMLHPVVTKGANRAVDEAIGIERALADIREDFAKGYSKLPNDRRAVINKFIKEANDRGLDYNYNTLKANGVRDDEMKLLKKWREAWDTVYFLDNRDFVKTLRHRGYKLFLDPLTETEMVAKPVAKRSLPERIRVYNPADDNVVTMNSKDIERIYEEGGTIAQLRTSFNVLDSVAEYVVSSERPGGTYLRSISEWDQVLPYRKGYYQVSYKDPQFIVKIERDNSGRVVKRQAVATAGSKKDAELMAKRLRETDEGEYEIRGDVKKVRRDSDEYWDLHTSGGRTSQRVRGKRLEDATSQIADPSHENILDPVEALTKSIRSVSQRVSMRDYLDATKTRFINQFKDVLPTDDFGRPRFPTSRKEIGKPGVFTSDEIADARTMFEYINFLENGYINAIDDAYKAGLNTIAELLGKYSSTAEKSARWLADGMGPTTALRHAAFKAYIALNPLRQIVVQSHQAVRLLAMFPEYVASSRMLTDFRILTYGVRKIPIPKRLLKSVGMTEADAKKMIRDFEKSGLFAAVDANNLVRGDFIKMADISMKGKLIHGVTTPVRISQKFGFDAGEQFNIMTSWLAHRDHAVRSGKKLDEEVMAEVGANARNFTYNMNLAGDMPYNRNMLNAQFQFMQVPHKALLQDFTNRIISPKDKAKLLAFDTIMWGTGSIVQIGPVAGALYAIQDEEIRRLITNGLEEYVLNAVISAATGTSTNIDFSDLAPNNLVGIWETVSQLWSTTELMELIASSPSGQLFFGNNPRFTNAFKDAARFFGLIDDEADPIAFSKVAESFAGISSGMSNYFKASYALEYGKKKSGLNKVTDEDVNSVEAVAQLFGFRTIDEVMNAKVRKEVYEASKQFDEDVKTYYTEVKRRVGAAGTKEEVMANVKILSEAWRVWGNDNVRARQTIQRLMENDVKNGDLNLFKSIQTTMGFMDPEDTRRLIMDAKLPQEQKQILLDVLELRNKEE